jgi:diaminohydroxyphosphoribosylaminopyrimidine deaminase/5-amino-6-(5-phosphoribosylamino)uracil reductase
MPYVCIMDDQKFMQRALDLATKGLGYASPNPMVGCLIVHEGRIIGEGWHQQFGGPHAEVMAVESVTDKSLIGESIVYVTLEPCSYHGKTPACTDLLLKHKPKKVVVASLDPNPKVSGRGLEILQEAGIEINFGILENESILLNKRFFVAIKTQRPYIILKWAQTADGFMARSDFNSKWISNTLSRQLVHKWRSEEDGILIGYNTVKYDNPQLTVRDWDGRNPARIVIDPMRGLEGHFKVFDNSARTYWLNTKEDFIRDTLVAKKFPEEHNLLDGLKFLYNEQIGSIIVEGGAATLRQFIGLDLWDEARIFESQATFGTGINAPELDLSPDDEQFIEEDRLSTIFNPETIKYWRKN